MDLKQNSVSSFRNQSFVGTLPSGLPKVYATVASNQHRESLEQYISSIFQAAYGANILQYLPALFCLRQGHSYTAALGLGSAASSPLFSEQYLQTSIELQVHTVYGKKASRHNIMELGNLVASAPGQGPLLYLLIAAALHEAGIEYLVFVANKTVRLSIERSGFTPVAIQAADPASLGRSAKCWGTYYEGDPVVMLADIELSQRQALSQPLLRETLKQYEAEIGSLAGVIRSYKI